MREPETRNIGAATYEVTPLGAKALVRLTSKVAHVAGPGLERLVLMGDASLDEQGKPQGVALNQASLFAGIGTVLAKLPETTLTEIIEILAGSTRIIGGGDKAVSLLGTYDMHFQGNLKGMFEWLQFALEVNYGPLFSGLVDTLIAGREPRTEKPSP
jgi:hypothetical protein